MQKNRKQQTLRLLGRENSGSNSGFNSLDPGPAARGLGSRAGSFVGPLDLGGRSVLLQSNSHLGDLSPQVVNGGLQIGH